MFVFFAIFNLKYFFTGAIDHARQIFLRAFTDARARFLTFTVVSRYRRTNSPQTYVNYCLARRQPTLPALAGHFGVHVH
jgi:hypothetical protein